MQIKIKGADEIKKLLNSADQLYNQVARRAMTVTVNGIKTDTDAEIRSIYNLKKSKVSSGIFGDTGTKDNPMMTVTVGKKGHSSSQPTGLIHFGSRQLKSGLSVQVLKSGSRKIVSHGFIADGRNENKQAFMRRYRYKQAGPYIPNPIKRPYAKLPKKYRLPVYKLSGPRLADAFTGRPQVEQTIKGKAIARMIKELDRQLDYAFSNFR